MLSWILRQNIKPQQMPQTQAIQILECLVTYSMAGMQENFNIFQWKEPTIPFHAEKAGQ